MDERKTIDVEIRDMGLVKCPYDMKLPLAAFQKLDELFFREQFISEIYAEMLGAQRRDLIDERYQWTGIIPVYDDSWDAEGEWRITTSDGYSYGAYIDAENVIVYLLFNKPLRGLQKELQEIQETTRKQQELLNQYDSAITSGEDTKENESDAEEI